jgi:hypothetical protein
MMRRREFIAGLGSAMTWPIAARAQQSVAPDIETPDTDLPGLSAIQAEAGMKSITALAAHNNARWCDAVCRAHDRPGEFHEALWLTRRGTPRFYPDAVTTSGVEAASAQLEDIADLIDSNRWREWFVKDSFHCLRLDSLGFEPLFDAEWIAMSGARPDVSYHQPGDRSTIVTDETGLSAWERSWAGGDARAGAMPLPRVFMSRLLADDGIAIVSIQGEDGSAGGGILNRGADVVGLSNLFGSRMDRVWRTLIAMAGDIFPGLPLVGYEQGHDLAAAKLAGFETMGALRIWRFPAKAR